MSSHDSSNYSKTWELSLYEQNRTPHEVITDDTEIAVSPKSLHNELMCPICLDILKNTMTTKECLHRFCQECIITALRAGNKECPTCRKKLISKRSLRRDPNFDALISKIYPNREEYDALHEKVLEKLNKKHLTAIQHPSRGSGGGGGGGGTIERQNSRRTNLNLNNNNSNNNNQNTDESQTNATTSTNTGLATNASTSNATNSNNHRPNHESSSSSRKRNLNSDESDMESRTSTERSHLQNDYDEIELVLKPHPKELNHNSKRFLKTTSNATIGHLSKYLTTRLCVETNTSSNSNSGTINNNNNLNTAASTSATACTTTTTTTTNQKSTLSNDATMDFNFNIYVSSSINNTENKQTTNNLTSPSQQQQQSHQLLAPNSTLEQIIDKYWKLNKPLELYYLYKGPTTTNNNSNLGTNTNSTTS